MLKEAGTEMEAVAQRLRQSSNADEQSKADYMAAVASEHQSLAESVAQVATVVSFGDVPVTVIASGKPNPAFGDEAQAYQAFWAEQSRALAGMSTNGTFLLVQESGHHLQIDAPDVVVKAIREMVENVRE
jgi:pimeloyl-ACP methyl ester carboxylesterase